MRERKKITGEQCGVLRGFQRNIRGITLTSFSSANEGVSDWQRQNPMYLPKRKKMSRSSSNSLSQAPVRSCAGRAADV